MTMPTLQTPTSAARACALVGDDSPDAALVGGGAGASAFSAPSTAAATSTSRACTRTATTSSAARTFPVRASSADFGLAAAAPTRAARRCASRYGSARVVGVAWSGDSVTLDAPAAAAHGVRPRRALPALRTMPSSRRCPRATRRAVETRARSGREDLCRSRPDTARRRRRSTCGRVTPAQGAQWPRAPPLSRGSEGSHLTGWLARRWRAPSAAVRRRSCCPSSRGPRTISASGGHSPSTRPRRIPAARTRVGAPKDVAKPSPRGAGWASPASHVAAVLRDAPRRRRKRQRSRRSFGFWLARSAPGCLYRGSHHAHVPLLTTRVRTSVLSRALSRVWRRSLAHAMTLIVWPGPTPAGQTIVSWAPDGVMIANCWPAATPAGTTTLSCCCVATGCTVATGAVGITCAGCTTTSTSGGLTGVAEHDLEALQRAVALLTLIVIDRRESDQFFSSGPAAWRVSRSERRRLALWAIGGGGAATERRRRIRSPGVSSKVFLGRRVRRREAGKEAQREHVRPRGPSNAKEEDPSSLDSQSATCGRVRRHVKGTREAAFRGRSD